MSQNQYSATEQPDPTLNERPACWQVVIEEIKDEWADSPVKAVLLQDMSDRDTWGRSKYGVPLQPFNGRDSLIDLYQEFLDATVYTKQYRLEHPEDLVMEDIFQNLLDNLFLVRDRLYERDGK